MTSRRVQKAASAIREVVSMAILTELKDPRVRDVTVTRVEVSDMRPQPAPPGTANGRTNGPRRPEASGHAP